jgi:hypothetical protein
MPNTVPDKHDERDLRVRRTPRIEEVRGTARVRKGSRQIEVELDNLAELYFDDSKNAEGPDA